MMNGFGFEVVDDWEKLPAGYKHDDVDGVGVDSRDRVYMITRGDPRVIVYEPDGTFVMSWGEDIFSPRTHGITVGSDDAVYTVDGRDNPSVFQTFHAVFPGIRNSAYLKAGVQKSRIGSHSTLPISAQGQNR